MTQIIIVIIRVIRFPFHTVSSPSICAKLFAQFGARESSAGGNQVVVGEIRREVDEQQPPHMGVGSDLGSLLGGGMAGAFARSFMDQDVGSTRKVADGIGRLGVA
jgi:hypothetical protein